MTRPRVNLKVAAAPLLRLEAWLFPVPPTVWLGERSGVILGELFEIGYFSYFLLLIVVGGALYLRPDNRPFRLVIIASVLGYFVCYVVFLLFLTEGPAYTLRALHTAPLHGLVFHQMVLLIQTHAGVHGNAFPSSHVAAGFVAVAFGWRYAPRLGAGLTPLLILLCLGAVYDRYHYVSDVIGGLVVGALVTMFVLWANRRSGDRVIGKVSRNSEIRNRKSKVPA